MSLEQKTNKYMNNELNKAKIRLLMPFQWWCVDGRGLHKHYKLLDLFKALKEKTRYNNQRTKCFCPQCDNELCGSDSYLFFRHSNDGNFEFYKCSKCGKESKWDFDCIIPLLIKE